MNSVIQFKTTTLQPFIVVAFACFAFLPTAQAVSPLPDGGYPGENTAEGEDALFSLTTGVFNTAFGFDALYFNTTGSFNTAIGFDALFSNTTGVDNTANGFQALFSNTTGFENTAIGIQALFSNTTGFFNTANGDGALGSNTTGFENTANGKGALDSNITGSNNTATGSYALGSNTGSENTADGVSALINNTGSNNIGLGANAGSNLTTGDNNIDIGNGGVAAEANTIRIGTPGTQTDTFIAGIWGVHLGVMKMGPVPLPVMISSSGHLGTTSSSRRFKKEIKPMAKASEAILALKLVTFHYKGDETGTPQFGLIAEEVATVNPDLVVRDDKGEIYTVRYDAVNAMLLNEFIKEHRTVQELKSTVAKQEAAIAHQEREFQSRLAEQQKQIKALTSGLEKVNAQLKVSKPASQIVVND